jgi:hypothetical protein
MSTNINFNNNLGISRGCNITLASNPITPLLLDSYPNASVAYSLRKLRTAYSGSAIRVRRNVDNAEQDFGFIDNDLDTDSMLDFVGYNLWTFSEDISQGVYIKSGLNTTGIPSYIDVETAPDSTLTGDKIIEDIFLARHYLRRASGIILNATNYNFSTYLKQGERTKVKIESQVSGTIQTCILDLTNGTVSSNGFVNTPVVTAETNGWYRFSITITSGTTSASNGLTIELINPLNETVYTGDGTSGAYVWGFQISQTSTVKLYQKTVATASGNGFVTTWYDQSTNGLNFTQITAGSQPRIVTSGLINTVNSLPAILGNGSFLMSIPSSTNLFNFLHNGSQSFITSVQKSDDLSVGVKKLYGNLGGNSARVGYQNFSSLLTINCSIGRGVSSNLTVNNNSGNILTTNQYLLSNEIDAGNATASLRSKMYLNGSTAIANNTLTNAPSTANAFANFTIFDDGGNGNRFIGSFQELVIYPSDQSSNRNGIESNINSYYSIY